VSLDMLDLRVSTVAALVQRLTILVFAYILFPNMSNTTHKTLKLNLLEQDQQDCCSHRTYCRFRLCFSLVG